LERMEKKSGREIEEGGDEQPNGFWGKRNGHPHSSRIGGGDLRKPARKARRKKKNRRRKKKSI